MIESESYELSVHRAELIAKSEAAFQKNVHQALSGKHKEKDHSVKPITKNHHTQTA